jgi:hypothetical protein
MVNYLELSLLLTFTFENTRPSGVVNSHPYKFLGGFVLAIFTMIIEYYFSVQSILCFYINKNPNTKNLIIWIKMIIVFNLKN